MLLCYVNTLIISSSVLCYLNTLIISACVLCYVNTLTISARVLCYVNTLTISADVHRRYIFTSLRLLAVLPQQQQHPPPRQHLPSSNLIVGEPCDKVHDGSTKTRPAILTVGQVKARSQVVLNDGDEVITVVGLRAPDLSEAISQSRGQLLSDSQGENQTGAKTAALTAIHVNIKNINTGFYSLQTAKARTV